MVRLHLPDSFQSFFNPRARNAYSWAFLILLSASIAIVLDKSLPLSEETSRLAAITKIGEELSFLTVSSAGLAWLVSEIWRAIVGLAGWIEKKRDEAERRVEERIESRAQEIAEERLRMREAFEESQGDPQEEDQG